jgi:diketogulonate reductase-like aldo/keto reductase
MSSDTDVPVVEVGDAAIPKLGLGTWQNTGSQCAESVETALGLGYRHIDTAQMYDNEKQVGTGIERAAVDREDVFLTTKVWRSNLREDDVRASVRESLDKLDTSYVDLLLIHWPHPRVPVEETLTAMADLQDDGLVSHLGVSNFTTAQLDEARKVVDSPLVTNQVLYNPLNDQPNLREYCTDHDLSLTAYSPLAHGELLDDEMLAAIGNSYDKTAPQVALRWLVQQDGVIVIPKATSRSHIKSNLDVFDFELTDSEMERISERTPGLKRRLQNRMPSLMRRMPL